MDIVARTSAADIKICHHGVRNAGLQFVAKQFAPAPSYKSRSGGQMMRFFFDLQGILNVSDPGGLTFNTS
jgi:hypothetical protein